MEMHSLSADSVKRARNLSTVWPERADGVQIVFRILKMRLMIRQNLASDFVNLWVC